MVFEDLETYTIKDIERLIADGVEENIHLDYKRGASLTLAKTDNNKRTEITKDVSAFANSDGGVIVYGLGEKDHKPESTYYPVDGTIITKEWLEQVIQRIQRRIQGILIFPIRIDDDLKQTIYVVKIPRSNNAPHMADNHLYFKRFNFSSVPMEEYEVRDLFFRKASPHLFVDHIFFYNTGKTQNGENNREYATYNFSAFIVNDSNNEANNYKLNAIFLEDFTRMGFQYNAFGTKVNPTTLDRYQFKVSIPAVEPIFRNEMLEIGHFQIHVDKDYVERFEENLLIKLFLFYKGGYQEALYVNKTGEIIIDVTEIERRLKEWEENIPM